MLVTVPMLAQSHYFSHSVVYPGSVFGNLMLTNYQCTVAQISKCKSYIQQRF